jgi:hypothetical protein
MATFEVRRGVSFVSVALALGVCGACGSFGGAGSDSRASDASDASTSSEADGVATDALVDATTDAGDGSAEGATDAPAPCTDSEPFGKVTELTDLEDVTSVRIARDGVSAFVSFALGAANEDIDEGPFPKGALNYFHVVVSPDFDTHPAPVTDPNVLFYEHGTSGARAIARATRAQAGQQFSGAVLDVLGLAAGGVQSREPYALGNGSVVYFTREPSGATSRDLYRASANGMTWDLAQVPGVSSNANEGHPVVSNDELVLYFSHAVLDGPADIYMAIRDDVGAAFSNGLPVVELSGATDAGAPSDERPTWLSPDRCTLLFVSNRSGSYRAYSASRR